MAGNMHSKRLSWPKLVVFLVIFGAIGYLIFKSFAAPTVTIYDTWELYPGGTQLAHTSDAVDTSNIGGRSGRVVKVTTSPTSTLWDAEQRAHLLGASFNVGDTIWFATSIYFPTDRPAGQGWDTTFEIHQPWNGPDLSYGGPAPFNLDNTNDQWHMVVRGGVVGTWNKPVNGGSFHQSVFGDQSTSFSNYNERGFAFKNGVTSSIQKGVWHDWLLGFHLAPDNTGWFEAWHNGVQAVPRTNLPTSYEFNNNNIINGNYRMGHNTSVNQNTAVTYEVMGFSTDFAALQSWQNSLSGTLPTGPVAKPAIPSGFTATAGDGLVLLKWNTNQASDQVDGYQVYRNDTLIKDGITSTSYTDTGLTNGTVYNYRVSAHNSLGYGGWTNPIAVTPIATQIVTPPQYISSSISAGQVLSGTVSWSVNASGSVASVEFWANGTKLGEDTVAPFSYSLNTATLTNGLNTLGLAIVGTDGTRLTPQIGQVIINNSTSKTGDLNGDNVVNIQDLSLLLSNYGKTGAGDLNLDGVVNVIDLSMLMSNYGK